MVIPLFIINVLMCLYPVAGLPMGRKTVYIFITYLLWGSVCYTAANISHGSMASVITDMIDYQEVRTGSRDDGTVYAIYSFSRKAGQALAGGIGGRKLRQRGRGSTCGSAESGDAGWHL